MIIMKRLFALLLLTLSIQVYAANWLPYINNINRMEYGAGTQNWEIMRDSNGWIYAANNDGLLQFDGYSWHLYSCGMMIRSIYHDNKERIYVGSFNKFGYFSPDEKGILSYHSLSDKLDKKYHNFNDIWSIYNIDHTIYFVSYNHIFKLSDDELSVIESKERMLSSANINGNLYVFKENTGVFLQTGQLFIPLASTEKISKYHISEILPYQEQKLILITEYQGIYLYDKATTTPLVTRNDVLLKSSQLYCAQIKGDKIYIGTIKSGLIIVDIPTGQIEQYDIRSGLQNNSVLCLSLTPQGNIWLGLDNGISYIDRNNPLSNLYTVNQNYGVGYASVIYKGYIYFGTNQGLYYSPWPITDIRHLDLKSVKNADGQVWTLKVIGETLFCGHNNGAFLVNEGIATALVRENGFWNFTPAPGTSDKVIAGSYTGLVLFKNEGSAASPRWKFERTITGFNLSSRFVEHDEKDDIWWIVHGTGFSAAKLSPDYNKVIEALHYPDKEGNTPKTEIFKDKGQVYFTTDSGVCQYSVRNKDFRLSPAWNSRFGNRKYLRVINNDNNSHIWYTQSGKLKISSSNPKGYITDSVSTSRLRNNLMSTFENIQVVNPDISIISTLDGFSLHTASGKSLPSPDTYKFMIRNVTISSGNEETESYYYNGFPTDKQYKSIVGKYRPDASYRFEMNPDITSRNGVTYYVQLKGLDEQMLELRHSGIKEYTGLKEGKYTFIIHSDNPQTGQSEQEEIELRIIPPWYRSIFATLIYLLLLTACSYGVYRLLNRRFNKQHQKRLNELKEEAVKREYLLKEETFAQEKKIVELENNKLQQELLMKSQELSNSMLNVIQKQEIFTFLQDELQKVTSFLRKEQTKEAQRKLNRLLEKIHANIEDEDNWQKLENNFNIVHNNFLSRLKERYPNLTTSELKLAAYIRMDLITKEVAPLFNLSERGMESARYRLRKKLGLSREESLSKFLQNF